MKALHSVILNKDIAQECNREPNERTKTHDWSTISLQWNQGKRKDDLYTPITSKHMDTDFTRTTHRAKQKCVWNVPESLTWNRLLFLSNRVFGCRDTLWYLKRVWIFTEHSFMRELTEKHATSGTLKSRDHNWKIKVKHWNLIYPKTSQPKKPCKI